MMSRSRLGNVTLHDAFAKVFILNLPGAEERRAALEGHLPEVGIVDLARVTWVRAVAGSVCPPPIWFRAGEGARGCFCSHVRMAQDAAMDGVESYFMIEDDAIFRADACERLRRVMAELPGDCPLFILGEGVRGLLRLGAALSGGEHLREPVALARRAAVMRAGNVASFGNVDGRDAVLICHGFHRARGALELAIDERRDERLGDRIVSLSVVHCVRAPDKLVAPIRRLRQKQHS